MAMCVQGELVIDGVVQRCPRLAEVGRDPRLPVESCTTKCRYCRSFLASNIHQGEYKKGEGWPRTKVEVTTVYCDYPHLLEAKDTSGTPFDLRGDKKTHTQAPNQNGGDPPKKVQTSKTKNFRARSSR